MDNEHEHSAVHGFLLKQINLSELAEQLHVDPDEFRNSVLWAIRNPEEERVIIRDFLRWLMDQNDIYVKDKQIKLYNSRTDPDHYPEVISTKYMKERDVLVR